MKNEKKLKKYETVWICDFCGQEFKTKNQSDKHELICKQNPILPVIIHYLCHLKNLSQNAYS